MRCFGRSASEFPKVQSDETGTDHWNAASPDPQIDPQQPKTHKAGKPLRASDVILALTVATVLIALVARLAAALFGCG